MGDETKQVVAVCSMYHAALNTLSQLKLDILSGEKGNWFFVLVEVIPRLWRFFFYKVKGGREWDVKGEGNDMVQVV